MLRFIVEEALNGTSASLNASQIARRALGKRKDFQSSKGSSVRVAANRLRLALRLYYSEEGRQDDIAIALAPGTYEPVIQYRAPTSLTPVLDQATTIMDRYQAIATQECHSETFRMIDKLMMQDPSNPMLMAAKADLLMDSYKHGYSPDPGRIDEAERLLDRAKSNDPDNGYVIFVSALASLHSGDRQELAILARNLVADQDDDNRAIGVWVLSLISDEGVDLCKSETKLFSSPSLPGWIHHAPFLTAYSDGDYETALCSGIRFGIPNWFWGSIDRSAALAQLNLKEAAEAELENAVASCPDLLSDTDRILGTYIPDFDTRAHVREGLERAGLREMA